MAGLLAFGSIGRSQAKKPTAPSQYARQAFIQRLRTPRRETEHTGRAGSPWHMQMCGSASSARGTAASTVLASRPLTISDDVGFHPIHIPMIASLLTVDKLKYYSILRT
eukprot:4355199-Pleurochrysis_carterae.AAC.3